MASNIGDSVTVNVSTPFGTLEVDFLIVDFFNQHNQIYIGYSKMNLVKIQYKADNKWYVLDTVNVSERFKSK